MNYLCNHSNKLSSFTCKWQEHIHKHQKQKNIIIHIKCTKVKCNTGDVLQSFLPQCQQHLFNCCFFFFVLMMQWRLHRLYILTLSERTDITRLPSHPSSMGGAPPVSGWSTDKVTRRWWKQLNFKEEMSTFFFPACYKMYLDFIYR